MTSSHPLALAGLPAHGGQLRPIAADIGHVMGDDQMVLGIDGDLHIVADNASPLTALVAIERASGSVRETSFVGRSGLNLLANLPEGLQFCRRRPSIFFLKGGDCLSLGHIAVLPAIGTVQDRPCVARDAGLHLLNASWRPLATVEVLVAIVGLPP